MGSELKKTVWGTVAAGAFTALTWSIRREWPDMIPSWAPIPTLILSALLLPVCLWQWWKAHNAEPPRTAALDQLIEQGRQMVADFRKEGSMGREQQFLERYAAFSSLKRHLSKEFHDKLNSDAIQIEMRGGGVGSAVITAFEKELDRLESGPLPANSKPKYVPLDDAIRYLGGYPVSETRMLTDPNFTIRVAVALRDALSCGDIEARARKFETLHGGIRNPPMHPMQPIPPEVWQRVDINAYWALNGVIPQIAAGRHPNAVETGPNQGLHDIQLDRRQLEALWPKPGMIE